MSGHINLQLGWPSPLLFPAPQLIASGSTVLQSDKKTAAASVYGPDAGYVPLREHIAEWLSSLYTQSATITADRICISNGASGNLDNILAKFTESGYTRNIWMIEPSYFLACPIFTDAGFEGRLRGVPEDDGGIDIGFLRSALQSVERGPHPSAPSINTSARYPKLYKHIIYAVPTFSNPSGKTMSLWRRQELVRVAREFDALVVTDDVYDALRWPGHPQRQAPVLPPPPPRIVEVDRTLDGGTKDAWGNAVSNRSFSKIIGPGVRTGWAESTPAFTHALSQLGSTKSGGCPSHIFATEIDEMLASGQLQSHVKDVLIPTFSSRCRVMCDLIEKLLVPLGVRVSTGKPYDHSAPKTHGHSGTNGSNGLHEAQAVAGGYFTYLTLPSDIGVSADKLARLGLEEYELKFAYGSMLTVEGDQSSVERAAGGFGNGIRLCWAWHSEAEIEEGILRLARLIKQVQETESSGPAYFLMDPLDPQTEHGNCDLGGLRCLQSVILSVIRTKYSGFMRYIVRLVQGLLPTLRF